MSVNTQGRTLSVAGMLNRIRLISACYFGCEYTVSGDLDTVIRNMDSHYQREHAEQWVKALSSLERTVGQ